MSELKLGDFVAFDVEGVKTADGRPFGYGQILAIDNNGNPRVRLNNPVPINAKVINLRPAQEKRSA
jgi:hypothetical protein